MRSPIPFLLALVVLAGPAAAPAQTPAVPPAAAPETTPEVAPDSPRASLSRFLDAARRGRNAEAAGYLEIPRSTSAAEAAQLASRLQVVLDRRTKIDFEAISPLPGGNPDDDLPPGVDQVARVPGAGGASDPVRMIRRDTAAGARWLFTRATVEKIDDWYGELEDRWLRETLPAPLLRPGPRGLLWWQWAALPFFVVLAWLLGRALGYVFRLVAGHLASRTQTTWDDRLLERTREPTTLFFTVAVAYFALPLLALYRPAEEFAHLTLRALLLVVVFWAIFRILDVIGEIALTGPWAKTHPTSVSLVPLLVRAGKIAVIPLALIAAMSELGYPVASLLAGLGIGGLALALAAQKTVENLFGSVSIGVDQPFRIGDYVKIEDFAGTVEAIGLRSTRVRTLDRTLITIPNGKLADTRVETFAARDRIRLNVALNLAFGTTAAQVREVLAGIEALLRDHPRIWPDDLTVRLTGLGPSALEVTVMCWFATKDWGEFLRIREELLLRMLERVEQAGTSLAYPTSAVQLLEPRR